MMKVDNLEEYDMEKGSHQEYILAETGSEFLSTPSSTGRTTSDSTQNGESDEGISDKETKDTAETTINGERKVDMDVEPNPEVKMDESCRESLPRNKTRRTSDVQYGLSDEDSDKEKGVDSDNPESKQSSAGSSPSPSPGAPTIKRRNRNPGESRGPKQYKLANPFKRPPVNVLKRTLEPFLQDRPCNDLGPKLGKCRECRSLPFGGIQKNQSNIFCRFFGFRKLRYTKTGSLAFAGFSNPINDPTQADLDLWLPSKEIAPKALDLELARFLIDQLGDQFCELVHQELDANKLREPQEDDDEEDRFVAWKRVVQGVREMCDVCDTTLFNFHWACRKCGFGVCIACYRARTQGIVKTTTGKKASQNLRDEFNWLVCSSNRQAHEMDNLMLTQSIAGDALTILGDYLHRMRAVYKIPQECGCDLAKRLNEQYLGNMSSTTNSEQAEKNEDSDDDDEGWADLAELITTSTPTKKQDTQTIAVTTASDDKQESGRSMELKHYVRRTTGAIRARKQPPSVNAYTLKITEQKYPQVKHSWLAYGRLLRLHDPDAEDNQGLFRDVWIRGQPVIVSNVADKLNPKLWTPEAFLKDFSELKNDLVNCMTGRVLCKQPMKRFWEGFEYVEKRLKDEKGNPMLLKLKDWPPGEDFAESLPSRFLDLMSCLPLKDYTERNGKLNLASRLPPSFVRPDLGPKMYIAYGSGQHLDKGTTNLHLDTSDAVNLMVHVGVPKDVDNEEDKKMVLAAIEESDVDGATIDRVRDGELPGALWHIYNFNDADKIRDLLNKVAVERGTKLEADHDPIHDQNWYLDQTLRARLVNEYDAVGFPMVQFAGDAIFIPAGAPHQVRNLHNCIKIAEDFVSPENVSHCFKLTEEFRELTETHSNHEDKLQIKNIIYHAVKDAVSVLYQNMSEEQKRAEGVANPPTSAEIPQVVSTSQPESAVVVTSTDCIAQDASVQHHSGD